MALLAFISAPAAAYGELSEKSSGDDTTVQIELQLGDDETRSITVALDDSAIEVFKRCKPAKVYADDDPWLVAKAAGGGTYVFFFAAEGTLEEIKGRCDPRRDKLYAVLRYPTDSQRNGTIFLPGAAEDKTYGDFVTMKVPLGPDRAKVATVALGMSSEEVKYLFPNAHDHAEDDRAILFDSVYSANKYLLTFTPAKGGDTQDPNRDRLSAVVYRLGHEAEAIYLLPRSQRGDPVVAEHRKILGISEGKSASGNDQ